jgi:hypothetical protein
LLALLFRVFGKPARPEPSPTRVVLLWGWLLVQSFSPAEVRPLLLRSSRFAVSRFLGFAVFLPRDPLATVKLPVSSSLRAWPPSGVLPRSHLAGRPQSASSSHELSVPTAHEGSKVHLTRVQPPATFRLQGLVTLLTVSSLRSRAGSVSHRQRSWDSPFGAFPSREVPGLLPPDDPTYRFTCRCSRRRSEGPAQQASVSGILPPERP